jgi:hypothetical protein
VWIELNARPGVAYPNIAHWHSVWRDKLTDYGAAFGPDTISTANRLPTITSNPTNRTSEVNTSTTFAVSATGNGTLYYQWFKNAAAIAGATNAVFTITSVTNADAGSYFAKVWNFMGHRTSTVAVLSVPQPIRRRFQRHPTPMGSFRCKWPATSAQTTLFKVQPTSRTGNRFTPPIPP